MVMAFGTSSNRWTKIALKSSTNEGRSRVLALLQDQIMGRLAVVEARDPSHKPLKDNGVFGSAGHRSVRPSWIPAHFFRNQRKFLQYAATAHPNRRCRDES